MLSLRRTPHQHILITSIVALISYLAHFKGRQECAISGVLFNPLGGQEQGPGTMDCQNRTALLDALSNGGRAAVDAPYTPRGQLSPGLLSRDEQMYC